MGSEFRPPQRHSMRLTLLAVILVFVVVSGAERYQDRFAAQRGKQKEAVAAIAENFSDQERLRITSTVLHKIFDVITEAWRVLRKVDLARSNQLNMADPITRQYVIAIFENTAYVAEFLL